MWCARPTLHRSAYEFKHSGASLRFVYECLDLCALGKIPELACVAKALEVLGRSIPSLKYITQADRTMNNRMFSALRKESRETASKIHLDHRPRSNSNILRGLSVDFLKILQLQIKVRFDRYVPLSSVSLSAHRIFQHVFSQRYAMPFVITSCETAFTVFSRQSNSCCI